MNKVKYLNDVLTPFEAEHLIRDLDKSSNVGGSTNGDISIYKNKIFLYIWKINY